MMGTCSITRQHLFVHKTALHFVPMNNNNDDDDDDDDDNCVHYKHPTPEAQTNFYSYCYSTYL